MLAAGVGAQESLVQIEARKPLTLAEVRAKLAQQKGKKYWRSVDELAETPEFAELVREGISFAGFGVDRSGFAAEFSEGDGRVDGAGRAGRMHEAAG